MNIAPLKHRTKTFTSQRQAAVRVCGAPGQPPSKVMGPPKSYLGHYFLEGSISRTKKDTANRFLIWDSASSRGPTVPKGTRWLFIGPLTCSSGQLALDLGPHLASGPHDIQSGQLAICAGPPLTLFFFLILIWGPIYPHGLQMDPVGS